VDATLETADGRPMLRFERKLAHPVGKVWRAVTEPDHLSRWFPWQVELDPKVGGRIGFTHPTMDVTAPDAVVTAFEPPRLFAYTWDDADLRWELTEDGDGCLLVFTHVFAERPAAAKVAAGWHLSLDALGDSLDGVEATPPADRWTQLNAGYVEAFGLLDGEVLDVGNGSQLRFEQELVHSRTVVWDAVAGRAQPGEAPPASCAVDVVPSGPVTELQAPDVLAFPWSADGEEAGTVRWTLVPQDFGTRVEVIQTVPAGSVDEIPKLRAAWHALLVDLADRLSALPPSA
jgi:uncharacterized protein YndB with AHSA1/START domain